MCPACTEQHTNLYFAGEHVKELQKEVQDCYTKISNVSSTLEQQNIDILFLKEELNQLLTELTETRVILRDIVNSVNRLLKKS